ncbi:MAG: HAMP domain-containing histidine kinase [Betaproteobacteria bacterium]|nr:HAMP domain-containing histidine kinase [Betaproteobacteria bacterium]
MIPTSEPFLKMLDRQGNRLMALMLALLHAAFVWGHGHLWGQALALAHYGVFLLWQPVFRSQQQLTWPRVLGVLAVGILLAVWDHLWAISLWCVLLAGLLGAGAMGVRDPRQRLSLWLAVAYLLLVLFLWLLPLGVGVLSNHGADGIQPWRDVILLLPLWMALLTPSEVNRKLGMVDLLYTLLFALLIGELVLGSYAAMHLLQTSYPMGVLVSVATLLLALMIVVWLWQPRGATTGLKNLFSRYVLSMGLPLEEWLTELSQAAEAEPEPERFLERAMNGFIHLPWSTGVGWRSLHSRGELGQPSAHMITFTQAGVEITFFTDSAINPAFALHLRMLAEVMGYFYSAKIREREMQANAYSQAVYETGSRLTHDVKNMLQSLKTLCSAAEHSTPDQAQSLQNLMQRQLPQMAKRLEITLDKLKSPERAADRNHILAREWWRNLKSRYGREGLSFEVDDMNSAVWLPHELFDSVADNLVQNALRKRLSEPDIHIGVELVTTPVPTLIVCDTGEAAPGVVVEKMFHSPVSSHDGLGIGLYQAAKQARGLGYRLELSRNGDGEVCFTLWQETLL